MSIIGTLETLPLPLLLRRIEAFTKTGLMAITQGTQSVELYFRNGKLMCVGPVRTDVSLAERLAQDGLLSLQMVREVEQTDGMASSSETQIALTLMEMGFIKREELRTWMTQKVTEVLRVLLTWNTGSIDFVEDVDEPSARLLVSLSISSFLDTLTASPNVLSSSATNNERSMESKQEVYAAMETRMMPASQPAQQSIVRQEPLPQPVRQGEQPALAYQTGQSDHAVTATRPIHDISQKPTLYDASQFIARSTDSPLPFLSSDLLSSLSVPDVPDTGVPVESYLNMSDILSGFDGLLDAEQDKPHQIALSGATPEPLPYSSPRRINTAFMQPDMIMFPVDVSRKDEHVWITPTQWQLLTRVDGQTPLGQIHMEQRLPLERVYETAGELIAEGFVQVVSPYAIHEQQDVMATSMQPPTPMELSPASRELVEVGLHNGLFAHGSHASVAPSWGDVFPDSPITQLSRSTETQSQWGNPGNGASFVIGQTWNTGPQPFPPLQASGPLVSGSSFYPNMRRG